MEGQIVVAGDFNQVMDNMIDLSKCTGNSKDRLAIHMLVEDIGLTNGDSSILMIGNILFSPTVIRHTLE